MSYTEMLISQISSFIHESDKGCLQNIFPASVLLQNSPEW